MSLLSLDSRWRALQEKGGVYDIGFDAPSDWDHASWRDRDGADVQVGADRLTPDLCKISTDHFIRATLPLEIRGADEGFAFGVWVLVNRSDFLTYIDGFSSGDFSHLNGLESVICNDLPGFDADEPYSCTLIAPQTQDARPSLTLNDATDLKSAQENGVSLDQLLHIYAAASMDAEQA